MHMLAEFGVAAHWRYKEEAVLAARDPESIANLLQQQQVPSLQLQCWLAGFAVYSFPIQLLQGSDNLIAGSQWPLNCL